MREAVIQANHLADAGDATLLPEDPAGIEHPGKWGWFISYPIELMRDIDVIFPRHVLDLKQAHEAKTLQWDDSTTLQNQSNTISDSVGCTPSVRTSDK